MSNLLTISIGIKNSIGCLLFLLPGFLFGQQWEITPLAPMPEAVSNNAVVEGMVNGVPHVYSFSGIDETKLFSGIHLKSWKYNTASDEWSSIDPLPDDMGKIAAGASRVGDIIYIMGGYYVFSNLNEESSDKVHRYDVVNDQYLTDGTPIPKSTDDHVQVVWRDSLIYLVTGWSDFTNISNVQIYNPAEDSWQVGTPVPNNNIYRSFGASGAIVGDTIFYFGGASSSGGFNIQNYLRKGVINPDDPTDVTWTVTTFDGNPVGYRMAATTVEDRIFWIGGSGITYNFNGIAYNGTGGVPTLNRILDFSPAEDDWSIENYNLIPMDLRGIASVDDTIKYIAGGMVENQMVSNQLFRLNYRPDNTTSANAPLSTLSAIKLAPNPVSKEIDLQLNLSQPTSITVKLFDTNGLCLRTILNRENFPEGKNNVNILVNQLVAGIYFLTIQDENGQVTKRFIKQ